MLIGFADSNSSVTLIEGGPRQRICVDIKPLGLPLDLFDYIPLTIRTESLGILCIINFVHGLICPHCVHAIV